MDLPILTKREQEVAVCILKGLRTKEIANVMCITESTIKFHISKIYKKSGVVCRPEFIAKYLKQPLEIIQDEIVEIKKEVTQMLDNGELPVGLNPRWPLKFTD